MKGLTDAAGAELNVALEEAGASTDKLVRLVVSPRGHRELRIDMEHPSDRVFEREGRKVLAVDAATAELCASVTLDYKLGEFYLV